MDAGDMDGAKVLVLGAYGFIGAELVQALARAGYQVTGFGRDPSRPGAFCPVLPLSREICARCAGRRIGPR